MSSHKQITLVVFGIGNVGSTLIKQLETSKQELYNKNKLKIAIPIVANSKQIFYSKNGASNFWESSFDSQSSPYKIQDVIDYVKRHRYKNVIAIDSTASDDLVKNYIRLIESGFHVISANKIANTLHYDFYKELRRALKKHSRLFLYETNVGAALPIIETIKNLHRSGEPIQKIRGVFSGSLSYIFNTFCSSELAFSKVVNQASKLGLTEPDAREDLSGKDAARKLLILARELGLDCEYEEIKVQSLVPKYLNGKTTLHQFNVRKRELDEPFRLLKRKVNNKRTLRYVAELDVKAKSLEVKLTEESKSSAIGQLKGSDSIFEIYTESYGDKPFIIQGAGAGKAVTARGLITDLIKLSNSLN